MRKNKRGWMRILEATIAVMLVSGVLIVVYSKQVDRGIAPAEYFFSLQRQILADVSINTELRLALLNVVVDNRSDGNFTILDDFIGSKVPSSFGYSLRVCSIDKHCILSEDVYRATADKDVFVEDIVISSELGDGTNARYTNGTKLTFFIWEGDRCVSNCAALRAAETCGQPVEDDRCGNSCGLGTSCESGTTCDGTTCVACTPTTEVCDDTIDNDCDGLVDMLDIEDCAEETVDPNLVAWFKFDGDTNDYFDIYNGVPSGGPEYITSGINNQALSFDKVDDYVTINSNEPISESEGSVSLWVYPREHNRNQTLFMGGENTANGETSFVSEYIISLKETENKLKGGWREDSGNDEDRALSDELLPLNTWTHVVSTWSVPENKVKLYVGGSLQSIDDFFTLNNKDGWVNELKIGKAMDGAVLPRYFNGYLDDLRIYNKSLSGSEVSDIYSSQGPCKYSSDCGAGEVCYAGICRIKETCTPECPYSTTCISDICEINDPDLAAWLKLDGDVSEEMGFSPANSGATPTTDKWDNSDSAMEFDGVSDVITIPYFGYAVPTTDITVSLWALTEEVREQSTFKMGDDNGNRFLFHTCWLDTGTFWDFGDYAGTGRAGYIGHTEEVCDGTWHHFVLTSGGGTMQIFIDGERVTNTGADDDRARILTAIPLELGGNGFWGSIDDFRVYRRVFSQPDVDALYNSYP